MKVAVGSLNPVKVQAVRKTFQESPCEVISIEADSKVSKQPLSHEEARKGAINRARGCLEKTDADLSIGLEGGVAFIDREIYLTNWAAIIDKENNLFVVSGPTFLLPKSFEAPLREGLELNEIMHKYAGIKNLGSKGGVVGLFTKEKVTREDVFHQMVQILWGQYQYFVENAKFSLETSFSK